MSRTISSNQVVKKTITYLETMPILGLVELDVLDRFAADNILDRRRVDNFLARASIGHKTAIRSPHDAFYAIYLPLLDKPVYLSLPGIPKSIVKLEDPTCSAINELKKHLREKYGVDHVDFWLQAAQNHTVRIASRSMRIARKRDKGQCILCRHENKLRQNQDMEQIRSRSTRRLSSHVISRKSIFWSVVERIDSEYDLFSQEGTKALFTVLQENIFICDPDHIVMLCHDHDQLLIRTIREFAKELA